MTPPDEMREKKKRQKGIRHFLSSYILLLDDIASLRELYIVRTYFLVKLINKNIKELVIMVFTSYNITQFRLPFSVAC